MSSKGRQVSDDCNLSLTGSGIHSAASTSRSRPGSAGSARGLRRPNSMTDLSKEKKQKPSTPKRNERGHGEPGGFSSRSGYSDISSVSTSKRVATAQAASAQRPSAQAVGKKGTSPSDDFLALFENTVQPKIKASGSKDKKPAANAVKVLWGEADAQQALKNRFTPKSGKSNAKSATKSSKKPDLVLADDDDWLETDPHSIFQQRSARSSSDEDTYRFSERLSQSFNRGAKSQNNFNKGDKHDWSLNSLNSGLNLNSNSNGNHSAVQGAITNNMTVQGRSPRVKVGLSGLENSYQNIKHKTPINQTRKVHSSHSESRDVQSGSNTLAENYIKKVNFSATVIQRWFKRHCARRKAGHAAMQRLLHSKKQTLEEQRLRESQNDFLAKDLEERRQEERKRIREDKAKQARQHAIQELQKKREQKRVEVKKKAEEEIAFLQANGKITKPVKTGLGKKKEGKPAPKQKSDRDTNINTRDDSSPEREQKDTGDERNDSMEEYYQNHLEDRIPRQDTDGASNAPSNVPTESAAKTTLDDLFETLKKLEAEEQLASARPPVKHNSWLDELEKGKDGGDSDSHSLSAENLQRLNSDKAQLPTKASLLSDDKMKSIMAFLDEVQISERLSSVDQEISKMAAPELDHPPLLGPSAEELADLEQANNMASEVTNTVLSQRLELEEKRRTVGMLQKALNQQRELTVRHARETDKEMKRRLDLQKDEAEETIKRHLSFIDQLIDDKKILSEKCESVVKELKQVDKKYQDKIKSVVETHGIEMQKLKDMHEAAEKIRREKWIDEKTKKIKEMTVKGLEPEIQRLIAKHKTEVKKIKQIHEAELLESDERAAQKYVRMTEELRDNLASEKEMACARERELAKQRYEKQIQQEEEAYQQQRRRLLAEVQEEKDRLAQQASRQRGDVDKLQQQLQDKHGYALEAMKSEFDKAREEQERRHSSEMAEMKERMAIEKEAWEENYRKKQETYLMSRERELKEGVKKDRNKEIELVIRQLEEDATAAREDCERVAENRIKRIREKYEAEMKEMERSEKHAMDRYNEMKARLTEVEGENECQKVQMKQKEQEIKELQKLTDKMHKERDRVSDIIRQEFADRLVFTEEENKRIKTEISELKARHRIELDKMKDEIEDIKKHKDEEMEEVHKRVKNAIVKKEEVVSQLKEQFAAAQKRADHLEGLLQQQRKQLLGR